MVSQGRQSSRRKVPSWKRREGSETAPHRRRKHALEAQKSAPVEEESTTSLTQSEDEGESLSHGQQLDNDLDNDFDQILTFDASHTVYIDKEKVYTKGYEFQLGKWDPSTFDNIAKDKAEDDASIRKIDIKLRRRTALVHIQSRKPWENSIDNDDDVERVNDKIKSFCLEGAKNIRLEYIIVYTNMTPSVSGKKHTRDNEDTSVSKKPKVIKH
jgi:hypothetical protein